MLKALSGETRRLARLRAAGFAKKDKLYSAVEARAEREAQRKREYDPLRSLFYDYQHIRDVTLTDIAIQNKKSVYEGLASPAGPKGTMNPERIANINRLADIKLKTILDSGMTREEVLGIKRKAGGPKPRRLGQDPFFMLIFRDHQARLNLIKDTEEFSIEKIVSLALRQNVDYDRSQVALGHRLIEKPTPHTAEKGNVPDHFAKPAEVDDHFRSDKLPTSIEYDDSDKLEMWQPIMKRPERVPKYFKLDRKLLHWRNTEYLSHFMSNFSKIKSGKVNNLSPRDAHTVSRYIIWSRTMGLLPQHSHMRPYHKVPLRTLEEDLAHDVKYAFDFENGAVTREEDEDVFNFRTQHFSLSHGFLQKVDITDNEDEGNRIRRATEYLLYEKANQLKEMGVKVGKELKEEGVFGLEIRSLDPSKLDAVEVEEGEQALAELRQKYAGLATEDLLGCLLAEKALKGEELKAIKNNLPPQLDPAEVPEESYESLLEKIQAIKSSIKSGNVGIGASVLLNRNIQEVVGKVQQQTALD